MKTPPDQSIDSLLQKGRVRLAAVLGDTAGYLPVLGGAPKEMDRAIQHEPVYGRGDNTWADGCFRRGD